MRQATDRRQIQRFSLIARTICLPFLHLSLTFQVEADPAHERASKPKLGQSRVPSLLPDGWRRGSIPRRPPPSLAPSGCTTSRRNRAGRHRNPTSALHQVCLQMEVELCDPQVKCVEIFIFSDERYKKSCFGHACGLYILGQMQASRQHLYLDPLINGLANAMALWCWFTGIDQNISCFFNASVLERSG